VLFSVLQYLLPDLVGTEFERGTILVACSATGGLMAPTAIGRVETLETVKAKFAAPAGQVGVRRLGSLVCLPAERQITVIGLGLLVQGLLSVLHETREIGIGCIVAITVGRGLGRVYSSIEHPVDCGERVDPLDVCSEPLLLLHAEWQPLGLGACADRGSRLPGLSRTGADRAPAASKVASAGHLRGVPRAH